MTSDSDSESSIDTLLKWCSARGIRINERIRVGCGEDGAIGVYTRDEFVECGTTLVSIPKPTILSIRNCLLSEHIAPVIYGQEAQLGLALGLYGELLTGAVSPWFGYLQSLPRRASIALFWDSSSEDERQMLGWIKGTMAEKELRTADQDYAPDVTKNFDYATMDALRRYFIATALPALEKANLGECASLEGFKHAYALVSSRAFIVDAYHGLAMVPIADAFNHSLENHTHLESDHDVCSSCGSLAECPHDAEDADNTKEDTHGLQAGRVVSDSDPSKEPEDTCEMVANAFIPPFTEVFNTYGEHLTNAQLLVRYGFVLSSNENDFLSWDVQDLSSFVLSSFWTDLINSGSNGDERYYYYREPSASAHYELGECFDSYELQSMKKSGEAIANDDLDTHRESGETKTRASGYGQGREEEDIEISLAQVLLERLEEVRALWHFGGAVWMNSNLVYNPDDQEKHEDKDHPDYREECINAMQLLPGAVHGSPTIMIDNGGNSRNPDTHFYEDVNTTDRNQRKKQTQASFTLNGEAKISHDLWLFCALFVLHAKQLRVRHIIGNPTTIAAERRKSKSNLEAESSEFPLASNASEDQDMLRSSSTSSCDEVDVSPVTEPTHGEVPITPKRGLGREQAKRVHLLTRAEEDVGLLRRIAGAQLALEEICADSDQASDIAIGDEVGEEQIILESSGTNFGVEEATVRLKLEQEQEVAPLAALTVDSPVALGRNAGDVDGGSNSLKRSRTSSSGSQSSLGSSDGRVHGRARNDTGKRSARRRREGSGRFYCGDDEPHAEYATSSHSEPEPDRLVACRRLGDDGMIFAAESSSQPGSDGGKASSSTSEAKAPSAVGGASKIARNLSALDTRPRPRPGRKSEERVSREFEGDLPYLEYISEINDRRTEAEAGTARSGSRRQDVLARGGGDRGLRSLDRDVQDMSLGRVVASIAKVVSALCAARVRAMVRPELDAAALGDVVDRIPPSRAQTAMAAQLALSERALLESLASGWAELAGRAAALAED